LPTVSICLPVYNGEQYLAQAIESALGQTVADFELLIGDDVSQDSSYDIISRYAKQDSRIIYWKNEANKGLFANYNETMRRSTGRYIKPFAQDDFFEANLLERMLSSFEANQQVALVACARRIVDAQGKEKKIAREYAETVILDGPTKVRDDLLKVANGIGEPSTVMFPRSLMGDGFDTNLYHLGDIDYWQRIILTGKLLYLSDVLVSFRRHGSSTTNRNARGLRYALDMFLLGRKYKDFLLSQGVSEESYAETCMEGIVSHMKFLVQHEGLTLSQLLAERNQEAASLVEELAGFKELSYRGLLMAAQSAEEMVALKSEWEEERNRLEDTIAKLVKSRSWKLTVPLRATVKAIHAARRSTKKRRR
jgi:glycosyltransferase involved in cell wall biosynthesis